MLEELVPELVEAEDEVEPESEAEEAEVEPEDEAEAEEVDLEVSSESLELEESSLHAKKLAEKHNKPAVKNAFRGRKFLITPEIYTKRKKSREGSFGCVIEDSGKKYKFRGV